MNYFKNAISNIIKDERETKETNIKRLKNFYFETSKELINTEIEEEFNSKTVFILKYNTIIISCLIENVDKLLKNHLTGYLNFYDSHIRRDFHIKYKIERKNEEEIEIVIKEWKEKFPRLNIDHVIEDLDKLVTVDTSELNVNSFHGIFHTREEF